MRHRFDTVVKDTHAALIVERTIPKLIPPAVMAGIFASASWVSVWDHVPPQAKPFVLVGYLALTLASPLLIKGKSVIVREKDALKHLDEQSGDPGRPATMLRSKAVEGSTPEALGLFKHQQNKLLSRWGRVLQAHKPSPEISKRWSGALAASMLAAFGTGIAAGDQRIPRLLNAFDFTAPIVVPPPPDVKAWITPPKGMKGLKASYLSDKTDVPDIHEKSVLHITVIGTQPVITLNGQPLSVEKTLASKEAGKTTYQYTATELGEGRNTIKVEGGPVWLVEIAPDTDPTITITGAGIESEKPGTIQLKCVAGDDHGLAGGTLVLNPAQGSGGHDIPASAKLPRITLPGSNFCDPLP